MNSEWVALGALVAGIGIAVTQVVSMYQERAAAREASLEKWRAEVRASDEARRGADEGRRLVAAEEARQRRETHLREIRKKDYLQRMHPREFERLVWEVYRKLGYRVEGTAYSGDSGVDGYLYKDGAKYVLQCKRVHGAVGEPVVRDLFGTLSHEGAAGGILVTTGTVSAKARAWAEGKPFEFVELDQIVWMIETTHPLDAAPWGAEAGSPDAVPTPGEGVGADGIPYMCPNCGSPLRERRGRHGKFLGCTRYPECRFMHALTPKTRGGRRR